MGAKYRGGECLGTCVPTPDVPLRVPSEQPELLLRMVLLDIMARHEIITEEIGSEMERVNLPIAIQAILVPLKEYLAILRQKTSLHGILQSPE